MDHGSLPFLFPNHRLVSLERPERSHSYESHDLAEEKAFVDYFRNRVLGCNHTIDTALGIQPLRYFDFTASGRFHADIEDELNEAILPYMANTHSETSATARIITGYYHKAFVRMAEYLHASEEYVLIPVGSGSTGAINRLINVLGLRLPEWCPKQFTGKPPLVIRSRMEHHSNDISWRETIAETVFTDFNETGTVDLNHLEAILKEHSGTRAIYGTFSAASNVTGIRNDVDAIARILHQYNAFAFFDYAAAAPHAEIVMSPSGDDAARKDAVFLSTHKLIGGPRTPGLLVAHKSMFQNPVPIEPGGGTVLYTSPWDHRYLPDIFSRETGGTPPIVQSIQAGLVFDLKARIGCERIERLEQDYLKRAVARWRNNPNLLLLGNLDIPRVGIVSLVFKGLHHELVVAMLNDYYGIQVRGGCMCAGTYGHALLQIDKMHSDFIRHNILDHGRTAGKPGWVRISLGATVRESEFQALLEAVDFVASEGKHLEREYEYHEESNSWKHRATI